eukprot:TRINITY_DN71419_c0_g1_i1.p1 TRINITY_DN71419_c0_g1~~TRINITY_DN71419_c0_g1_i1.p1  ORF type:complete len:1065 (+),score=188.65 TRINITY_DN71419_c0_g1_i1:363-3197(+)
MGLFGFRMRGMFGDDRRRARGPQLCKTRAIQFMFKDVADLCLSEVSEPVAGSNAEEDASSSGGAAKHLASDPSKPVGCEVVARVSFTLDTPVRCFEEPRDAQDHFMRPSADFAGHARHVELGFASEEKAKAFHTVLSSGIEEGRRQKQQEQRARWISGFYKRLTAQEYGQRALSLSGDDVASLFAVTPSELASLRAHVEAMPVDAWARKSICRWNLVPSALTCTGILSTIVLQTSSDAQDPEVRHARVDAKDLELMWQYYFEQRARDERALAEDLRCRSEDAVEDDGEWDTGDGQVPRRKRYDFTMQLRSKLARALVSSRSFSTSNALEVCKGLFVHHFYVCEDGGIAPRTVEITVRWYSHVAEPSAIELQYTNHCRARMSFNEQFNYMEAELLGLVAIRENIRSDLNTDGTQPGKTCLIRQAIPAEGGGGIKNVCVSLAYPEPHGSSDSSRKLLPCVAWLKGHSRRSIFRQSMEHDDFEQKEYVCPADHLRRILGGVLGESHPFLQTEAAMGRKPLTIICCACGLNSTLFKSMPYNKWALKRQYGKNKQAQPSDGMLTDGEEVRAAFAARQPSSLVDPMHQAAVSNLPDCAKKIVFAFLQGPLKLLRQRQLVKLAPSAPCQASQALGDHELLQIWRNVTAEPTAMPPPKKRARFAMEDSDEESKFYDSSEDDASEESNMCGEHEEQESEGTDPEGDSCEDIGFHGQSACQDGTALAIKFWEQEEEERLATMNEQDYSCESIADYEEAMHMVSAHKKIALYKGSLESAQDDDSKEFYTWKLNKYKGKLQSIEDGWMVDPDGSEGTSWCSSDLDETEPTAEELAEKQRERQQASEEMRARMEEREKELKQELEEHNKTMEERRSRDPERMRRIEDDIAREEAERKAELCARKARKKQAMEKIQKLQPQLWLRIIRDRKEHREKRVRMGKPIGKKYGADGEDAEPG